MLASLGLITTVLRVVLVDHISYPSYYRLSSPMNSASVCKLLRFSLQCSLRKYGRGNCNLSRTIQQFEINGARSKCRRLTSDCEQEYDGGSGWRESVGDGRGGHHGVLLCGVLSWLGLAEDEPTEEDNLTTTVKMAILAIQVT